MAAVYARVEKGRWRVPCADLGGGTFDVAVVGMADRRPRIWGMDGETRLGGLDWDQRMFDLLWGAPRRRGLIEVPSSMRTLRLPVNGSRTPEEELECS